MGAVFSTIGIYLLNFLTSHGFPLLSKTYQKRVAGGVFAVLILLLAVWLGYTLGHNDEGPLSLAALSNVAERIDFETGIPKTTTLDVCDATPPDWYGKCADATAKLRRERGGLTGQYSLVSRLELSPHNPRTYSVNFFLDTPVFVDAIAANVYIPDASAVGQVSLLVKTKGDRWVFSDLAVDRDGWIRLFIDLRQFRDETGKTLNQVGVFEIDIDFFISQSVQKLQEITVKIDDIEMYYPLSVSSTLDTTLKQCFSE